MKRKAFTLIELLVVLAIIGLLSTIAIISLSTARRQSRNVRRIADAKQLVTAFGLGLDASATGQYPSTGGDVWKCIGSVCTGGWAVLPASATVDAFFTPFMAKPTDPDDKNARCCEGYIYNGAFAVNGGLPTIEYLLEFPATCGIGKMYGTTATYVSCIVGLN